MTHSNTTKLTITHHLRQGAGSTLAAPTSPGYPPYLHSLLPACHQHLYHHLHPPALPPSHRAPPAAAGAAAPASRTARPPGLPVARPGTAAAASPRPAPPAPPAASDWWCRCSPGPSRTGPPQAAGRGGEGRGRVRRVRRAEGVIGVTGVRKAYASGKKVRKGHDTYRWGRPAREGVMRIGRGRAQTSTDARQKASLSWSKILQ